MSLLKRSTATAALIVSLLLASSALPAQALARAASNFTLEAAGDAGVDAGRELSDDGVGAKNLLHVSFSAYNLDFDSYLERTDGVFSKDAKVHILSGDGAKEVLKDPPASHTYKSTSGDDFTLTLLEEDGSALDGLVVKDGRTFHLVAADGAAPEVTEDVDEDEGGKCGVPLAPSLNGDGNVRRRLRSVGVELHHPIPRKLSLSRWKECYDGDEKVQTFSMGIAVDNGLYRKLGGNDEKVANYVSGLVAEANLIYEAQLGIRLVVGDLVLMSSSGSSVSWNTCSSDINSLLGNFREWTKNSASTQGLWHLLTDCFPPPGTVGLAYVGTLCYRVGYNTGVSSYTGGFWKVFAHEVGHNFGARHSFEEGQGKTGGIMDYGDGKLDGRYQFNTQYRKAEICAEIQQNIASCSAFEDVETTSTKSPTKSPTKAPTKPPTKSPTVAATTCRCCTGTFWQKLWCRIRGK